MIIEFLHDRTANILNEFDFTVIHISLPVVMLEAGVPEGLQVPAGGELLVNSIYYNDYSYVWCDSLLLNYPLCKA